MKKSFLSRFTGICLLLVITIAANAQLSFKQETLKGNADFEKSASKDVSDEVEMKNVNRKAVKDFALSFKNVTDEKWFKQRDGFVAMFTLDDIDYLIAYDKKGRKAYTIRNYNESKLPVDLRHIVKSTYYDYAITVVQEIETPFNPITYIVHLEGKTELINLRICDGKMEEWQKFKKSE